MEEELPMDSDSSDEDYVPAGKENEASEEESGNESADEPGSDVEEKNHGSSKKRKKQMKTKKRKKIKSKVEEEEEVEEEKENSEVLTEEERKKKSDSLWADFMKDCGPPPKKITQSQPVKQDVKEIKLDSKLKAQPSAKPEPATVTQILTFAGEEVMVEKPAVVGEPSKRNSRGSTGGLSAVLSMIGKKGKLSTLEKTKLDWDSFKVKEGIKEDLARHNKGRNGYLEKQDFLQRADLRQFEIEKSMRSSTRKSLNR